jgi:hypothetical protein
MLLKLKNIIVEKIIEFLQSRFYYVAKPHFYNPIPDKEYLLKHDGYWNHPYPCYGIEFNDDGQLSLIEQLAKFAVEINELPDDTLDPKKNQSFLDMDLEFLYCMIRLIKPKRFVEIGAGWSSLIAMHALSINSCEGNECEHTIIEPYPSSYFLQSFKKADRFIQKPIQEVSIDYFNFNTLENNDILFIDTSHVAKYGSDVNYLYFYLIPCVGSGCYVHIHDIFIPSDYHQSWIINDNNFWTEQYLVMAFLMYNQEFKIRIAAQYLCQKYRDKLNSLFPRFQPNFSPGSLWLQKNK